MSRISSQREEASSAFSLRMLDRINEQLEIYQKEGRRWLEENDRLKKENLRPAKKRSCAGKMITIEYTCTLWINARISRKERHGNYAGKRSGGTVEAV